MLTITLRADPKGQATAESGKSASATRHKGRGIAAVTGVALAASLFAASGAQAQNCPPATPGTPNVNAIAGSISGVASMINASITATSTAFLLQSSSFIGSPPNPAPDQQGGGIWVRGVGGEVSVKSATTTNPVVTNAATGAVLFAPGAIACSQKVSENFAGVQFGSDIAKLNVSGWNFHLGTTLGVLGSRGTLSGGAYAFTDPATGLPAGGGSFTSTTQVPFVGIYAAATKGGFFIDGLLRAEYYQSTLTGPGDNLFGQSIDAHGWAFSSSAGYNWAVPNSKWFIEPSGSVVISRTKVDPLTFTTAGTPGFDQLPGTLQLNEIKSDIGRLGLRVGQTIEGDKVVWQPFAAVSVWHEFGSNPTANYASAPGCCAFGPVFANLTGAGSTTTIGTFGQYSLGVSASVIGTGWLGFARVDYRDGPNLQGLSGTAGLRYQFTPDMAVASHALPVKAPVLKAPVMTAVNWTGFYIGGFGGAILGRADWGYEGGEVSPHVGGFDAGGNIGFDWQSGRWVLGAVAELEGTNTKGGMACNPNGNASNGIPANEGMALTTCNASIRSLGDVAARVGYTWDRALFYVKAGGAWANERFTGSCNNVSGANFPFFPCTNPVGAPTTGFSANNNRGGWIIGNGTEFALTPNWSARAESDYISFGDRNVTATDGSALKVGMHVWETRIGLNYRFSSGPGVVAARD
jgi:opacity protein-like surface antigen